MQLIKEILSDISVATRYFIKRNLGGFANTLEVILPYLMFWIGLHAYSFLDWALIIPVVMLFYIYCLRAAADKLGTGNKIPPIPAKRFTRVDEDGEVSIEYDRIQEVLLYLGDLEDWLERKNML